MRGTTRVAVAVAFAAVAVSAAAAFGGSGSDSADGNATSVDRHASRKHRDEMGQRHKSAQRARHHACGGGHMGEKRMRFVHGELKFQRDDGFVTRTVDQGEVTAVNAGAKTLTIKRADGDSVSATGTDETRVCRNGEAASFGAIRAGDVARIVQRTLGGKTELRAVAARSPSQSQTERTAA